MNFKFFLLKTTDEKITPGKNFSVDRAYTVSIRHVDIAWETVVSCFHWHHFPATVLGLVPHYSPSLPSSPNLCNLWALDATVGLHFNTHRILLHTCVCVSAHAYAHQQHTTIKLTLTTHSHSNNFLNDLHEETIPWSASTYCMDKTSHLTVYPASSYPSHTSTDDEAWYWPKCIVHSR